MTRRSRGREVALQLLFQHDQNHKPAPRGAVERFVQERLAADPDNIPWCLALFDGTIAARETIDAKLIATAENWRLHRMTPVDRNVLRLGAYELLHDPAQLAPAIVIDEMVELARRFGSAESPAFVNGILDQVAKARISEPGTQNENPDTATVT